MKVIKRNNDIVEFDNSKIETAILKCIKHVTKEITEDDKEVARRIAYDIHKDYKDSFYADSDCIDIEEIQDDIEYYLMKHELNDIAKSYILYRESRKGIREQQAKMYEESQKKIEEIMSNKNIENANANVDEASFSGKNAKITSHFLKEYALDNLIDKKVATAHRTGLLYTHDIDSYGDGRHNCLNIDFNDLFEDNEGFKTRNGDVRRPNDIMTFFQLVAVTFQCQSQVQFGGVGSTKIDYEGAPYVDITFKKCFRDALMDRNDYTEEQAKHIVEQLKDLCRLENESLIKAYPIEYKIAERHVIKKTLQGAESLYHNLNTLESRAGSQVPFTSINYGTDTSPEGRLVSKSLLKASINGIGKYHKTSIFPISIFKYMKGVNDKPGTPNYDLYELALESLSKRIYPNIVNCDISYLPESVKNDPNCQSSTMGCRTNLGFDVNGMGWNRGGRGNVAPVTMNLVELGIKNGICLGERKEADLESFWKDLEDLLKLAEKALLDRFKWISEKQAHSGYFMYANGTMKNTLNRKLDDQESVYECMKHSTLAIGYIGIAEMCKALFGKHHGESQEIWEFAYSVVERIHNFCKECVEKHQLNFSCYATPAESTCMTLRNKLVDKYGVLDGITDREYITNSHHIPVYFPMEIYKKIDLEAPFSKLATGGYIMYIELESSFINNTKAIQKIIDYAMAKDIYYFAINFPIDTCMNCGYQSEIPEFCPECGSDVIERLRRVTGYLTTDYSKFNKGKIAEVIDRVKHDFSKLLGDDHN